MTDTSPQSPAVSETDAATVARAIYKILYPEFEDEGQCLAQMQALSDHMGMDVVACAHSAVAALASRPSPERREIVEALREIVACTHRPNPQDQSRIDVAPGQHRRFQAAIETAIRSLADKTNASPSPPAGEWQPISSAPKDGTAIWLVVSGRPYIGYCEPADGWLRKRDLWFAKATYRRKNEPEPYETLTTDKVYLTSGADVQPTHWQPLPAPPPSAPVQSGQRGED
jgi:hypothetical protein